MIFLLENNIRGSISSVMGDRYIKSNENEKTLFTDAISLYGWAMSEYLTYDAIKFDINVKLEDILNTPDDSDIVYVIEVDLKFSDNIKEKTKKFPFAPENIIIHKDRYTDFLKKIKPKNFTKVKKLL